MDQVTGKFLGFVGMCCLLGGGCFAYGAFSKGDTIWALIIAVIALVLMFFFFAKAQSYNTRCPQCRQFRAIETKIIGQQDGAVTRKKDSQGKWQNYVRVTYHKLDSCPFCGYQHDYYETKDEIA